MLTIYRLLPKSLLLGLKPFLTNLRLAPGDVKLAFRAQAVDIAYLPLRQDFLAKNVLMTSQRDFGLDNSL
jgi:hypothetical protein